MDKGKDEEKVKDDKEEVIKRLFGKDNPTIDEVRAFSRNLCQNTIQTFDDALKSRWIRKDKRANLTMFRAILQMQATDSDIIYQILDQIDELRKTVIYLGKKAESTQGKTQELTEALSKLKHSTETTLAASYAVVQRLDQLMKSDDANNQQNKPQKSKDTSGDYRV
ncbi:MAG: hypothetical protein ABSG57_09080 [Candidatus Bathyarchaeia archaeon]